MGFRVEFNIAAVRLALIAVDVATLLRRENSVSFMLRTSRVIRRVNNNEVQAPWQENYLGKADIGCLVFSSDLLFTSKSNLFGSCFGVICDP